MSNDYEPQLPDNGNYVEMQLEDLVGHKFQVAPLYDYRVRGDGRRDVVQLIREDGTRWWIGADAGTLVVETNGEDD